MLKPLTTVFAFLGLVYSSAYATPQASSTAIIGNVAYQLVDLDPNDGIAPSITFSTFSSIYAGIATDPAAGYQSYNTAFSYDQLPFFSTGNDDVGLSTEGSIQRGTLSTSGQLGGAGGYYTSAQQSRLFSLSANTELIVTGHAKANVTGNLTLPDMASGSVSFQIIDSQHANPYTQLAFYSNGAYNYNNLPTSMDENFTLNFYNRGASTLDGTIDVYAGASALTTAAPVPEPEAIGMLAAGLGVLSVAARRRRRKA